MRKTNLRHCVAPWITIEYKNMSESYFQSPDFKRASGTVADSGVKFIFKWIGIFIKGVIDFITSMVKMAAGK